MQYETNFMNGRHHIFRNDNGMCRVFESQDGEDYFESSQFIMFYFNTLDRVQHQTSSPYALFNDKDNMTLLLGNIGRNKNIELHGVNSTSRLGIIFDFVDTLHWLGCYVIITTNNPNVVYAAKSKVDAIYLQSNIHEPIRRFPELDGYCVKTYPLNADRIIKEFGVKLYGYREMLFDLTPREIIDLPEDVICFEISTTKKEIPSIVFDLIEYSNSKTLSEKKEFIEDFIREHKANNKIGE